MAKGFMTMLLCVLLSCGTGFARETSEQVDLSKTVLDLSVQNQSLKSEAALLADEKDMLQSKLEVCETRLDGNVRDQLDIRKKAGECAAAMAVAEKDNVEIKKALETLREENRRLDDRNRLLLKDVEKVANIEAFTGKCSSSIDGLKDEKAALVLENQKLKELNTALEKKALDAAVKAEAMLQRKAAMVFSGMPRKAETDAALKELRIKNAWLDQKIVRLTEENARSERKTALAADRIDAMTRDIARACSGITDISACVKDLKVRNARLGAEAARAFAAHIKATADAEKKFRREMETLQKERDRLAVENGRLTNANVLLEQKVVEAGTLVAERNRKVDADKALSEANSALKGEIVQLRKDNERVRGELGALSTQIKTLGVDAQEIPSYIKELRIRNTRLGADNARLTGLNSRITAEADRACDLDLRAMQARYDVLAAEKAARDKARSQSDLLAMEFEAKARDLQRQIDAQKGVVDGAAKAKADNEVLRKENDKIRSEYSILVSSVEMVGAKTPNVRAYVKELKVKNARLGADNVRLIRIEADLERSSRELYVKYNNLKNKVDNSKSLSAALMNLKKDNDTLIKEHARVKGELKNLQKNLDLERASLYREAGVAYARNGFYGEAIDVYLESLKLDPGDGLTHYYLGILYSKIEEQERARYYLREYLKLEPQAKNKSEVLYILSLIDIPPQQVIK